MGNEFCLCLEADSQQGPVPRAAHTAGPGCGLFVQALGLTSQNNSLLYSRGEAASLLAESTARFTTPGHQLCWQPMGRNSSCYVGPALPISCQTSAQESPFCGSPWQEAGQLMCSTAPAWEFLLTFNTHTPRRAPEDPPDFSSRCSAISKTHRQWVRRG